MGYYVTLVGADPIPEHQEGSNIVIGRDTDAGEIVACGSSAPAMSVTYNYGAYYRRHISAESGLGWLHGRKARATVSVLKEAVGALGTEQSGGYWDAAPGNAGHALSILLHWAALNPDAAWEVD